MEETRRSERLRLKNSGDGGKDGSESSKKRKRRSSAVEGTRRSKRLQVKASGGVDNSLGELWKNLHPDILAKMFGNIPADRMVRTVPFVCKSWSEAVAGPYCWWNGIDLESWCRRREGKIKLKADAVRCLVSRCGNTCNALSAYALGTHGCSFVLRSAKCLCLKALKIPGSQVTNKMVTKYAQSLKMLTVLDISDCTKITRSGLEVLGKSCPFLTDLKRNLDGRFLYYAYEEEAMVIAKTMLRLERLGLRGGSFTDLGLKVILTNCKNLKHLDIQWCYNVKLEGNLKDMCRQLIEFFPSQALY